MGVAGVTLFTAGPFVGGVAQLYILGFFLENEGSSGSTGEFVARRLPI